jgi:hypothetical protein
LQIKTKIVSCHTADSKPVEQEVNGTMFLPSLVFPAYSIAFICVSLSKVSRKVVSFAVMGTFTKNIANVRTTLLTPPIVCCSRAGGSSHGQTSDNRTKPLPRFKD